MKELLSMKRELMFAAVLVMALTGAALGSKRLEPVMWADVPDVAPMRVGDTYYMVSTTMHFNPGIPVMASKDLVNWKIISYCYQTVEDRAKDRLENGEDDYMLGTWASSIRYNEADGFFYVTSFNNNVNATYLFRTKDPTKSNWEFFRLRPKQYDESLWIEDGRFYVFATVPGRPYKVRLTEMKPDFSGFVDEGKIILENVTDCAGGGGLGEGTQVFKRNGWCYIVNIGWPKGSCRTVIVHRARSWDGPWEGKIVFAREGIAQGSFIDRSDGSWVAVLFGDRGAVGRIPYILETEWKDDWPVVQPREVKDAAGKTSAKVPGCVVSDEFDGAALKLEWQWNHNPDNANWSLSERPGWMRLKAGRVDGDLLHARNTLTQRTFGPACEGETCLDVTGLKEGDVAGLALLQKLYGLAAVRVNGGKKELVLWSPDRVPTKDKQNTRIGRRMRERERVALPPGTEKVYLKAVCDFTPAAELVYFGIPASTDMGKFYYSFDGKGWIPFGDAFDLVYTIPHFIGYRFGLVCFSTKDEGVGGFTDFDYLRLGARDDAPFTSDGSNPIVKTRFSPDPAPVVDGEWLYVFAGHDAPDARGYTMRDWGVVRTKDMKTWEDLGLVMTPAVFKWATPDNRAWASQAQRQVVLVRGGARRASARRLHRSRRRGEARGAVVRSDREAPRRPRRGFHRSVGVHRRRRQGVSLLGQLRRRSWMLVRRTQGQHGGACVGGEDGAWTHGRKGVRETSQEEARRGRTQADRHELRGSALDLQARRHVLPRVRCGRRAGALGVFDGEVRTRSVDIPWSHYGRGAGHGHDPRRQRVLQGRVVSLLPQRHPRGRGGLPPLCVFRALHAQS